MSKPPTIKCRQCGKQQLKSDAIQLPNKFWFCCQDCADKWAAGRKKHDKSKEEYSPLRKLTDYVQTYAPDTKWVKFVQTVKKMQGDYGLTPQAIHYTLWYMREHLRLGFDGSGLPLVPYYAEAAKKYYNWRQKMQQVVADWRLEDNDVEIVRQEKEEDVFS